MQGTGRRWTKRFAISAAAGALAYLIASIWVASSELAHIRLLDFGGSGAWWADDPRAT